MRMVMTSGCLLVSAAFLFSMASPQAKRSPLDPYNQWVLKCLKDFEAIKPGLTRADVEKKLIRVESFYDKGSPEVYFHNESPYFKIGIEFTPGPNSTEDKVLKVSKPYLEGVHF